ncbi:hypothetical protein ACQPXM_11915 [Kribbella sp. CA-253562]|uniref:hypothetical protein n=1 Tax=Kribbella sp. CA-253562 TaxID=3239942 RepID=UPI003D937727
MLRDAVPHAVAKTGFHCLLCSNDRRCRWPSADWLVESSATREVTIESAPLEEVDATLLQFTVRHGSRLAGVTVAELRL